MGKERGGASSRQRTQKGPEAETISQCSRNIKEQCDWKGVYKGEKHKDESREAGRGPQQFPRKVFGIYLGAAEAVVGF